MNSLNKLNQTIESVNHSLTDDNISELKIQISVLSAQYKANKAVSYLFKMLASLANYLGSKKDKVHTDTLPMLNSIVVKLQLIITDQELTKSEINVILSSELEEYQSLKNKIISAPLINDKDLDNLRAVILGIDWEISDNTIESFEKVITPLLSDLKFYKIHYAFVKIIHSIVQYIGKQKADVHINTISFLHSVFGNFEQIVKNPRIDYNEKQQLLVTAISDFKDLKYTMQQFTTMMMKLLHLLLLNSNRLKLKHKKI